MNEKTVLWVAALVAGIVQGVLAWLTERERTRQRVEDGARNKPLTESLRKRIRDRWGAARLLLVMCVTVLLGTSCATRTIYVPSGEPVRLRASIKRAKVWVLDKDGKPVPARMTLPEGWYCLPMDE